MPTIVVRVWAQFSILLQNRRKAKKKNITIEAINTTRFSFRFFRFK